MRVQSYRRHGSGSFGINMTPMIDVTFLLLTFFMLSTHFASAEKRDLDLPRPDDNQAVDRRFRDKVILNVSYRGTGAEPAVTFGPISMDSMHELADRLADLARTNPRVQVILRADRRLDYGSVRRIMEHVAAQNLRRLQVVTELE